MESYQAELQFIMSEFPEQCGAMWIDLHSGKSLAYCISQYALGVYSEVETYRQPRKMKRKRARVERLTQKTIDSLKVETSGIELRDNLLKLSEKNRAICCLLMRGWTIERIGGVFGISKQAIAKRIDSMKEKFLEFAE